VAYEHELKLELLDIDGEPFPHAEDGDPVQFAAEFEVGRRPGVKPGMTFVMPFAQPFGALDLAPGAQYLVRLSLDGASHDEWRAKFRIRNAPPAQLAA